jgi:hypothetical protein
MPCTSKEKKPLKSDGALASKPAVVDLHVDALDGGPGDAMGRFFLARIAGRGREGVIEGGTVDVLGVRRQMARVRARQIFVGLVGRGRISFMSSQRIAAARGGYIPHRRTNQLFTNWVSTA